MSDMRFNRRSTRRRKLGDEFLSRVPYASLMSTLMCGFGVILFAVMVTWAYNASVEQIRRALQITNIPSLTKIQVTFIIIAVFMSLCALALLTIGAFSTGSTRDEFYRGYHGHLGGRVANAAALIISYILQLCWIIIFAILAILAFIYFVFTSICSTITYDSKSECLNLTVFRPIIHDFSEAPLMFCGGNLQQFCALSSSASIWYICSLIAVFIIIVGLLNFVACAAANYTHVTSGMKYARLREDLLAGEIDRNSHDLRHHTPPRKDLMFKMHDYIPYRPTY